MSEPTSNTDAAQIVHELATLGEAPPSAAELAHDAHDPEEPEEPDLASVARLAELAEPLEFEDLSELELHRGWRAIEQRMPGAAANAQPARKRDVKPWLFAAVGVAAAAVVLLIVLRTGEDSQQAKAPTNELRPEQVMEVADQARAALRVLDDGQTDTERATQLATAYQVELDGQHEDQGEQPKEQGG